jgi:SpoVK/Ycf46/Vps4 family AAA+-type ATPase
VANPAPDFRRAQRQLPDPDMPGIADARLLPDDRFSDAWSSIVLPAGLKERLVRGAASRAMLRAAVPFETMPLHGVVLLTGLPGVGKTTLARGLADKVARTVQGVGDWAYIEVDPHQLASSSLGRSQRSVEQLFGSLLDGLADDGPLVVLLDEVETLLTDRAALSMEANPIDVHRAVDAALVGLDRLASRYPHVLVLATSNFPAAIDPALGSRADEVIDVPLPDQVARRAILRHTVEGVAKAFPGAKTLLDDTALDRAASASDGLDGRRLRKAVATACAVRAEAQADPNNVTVDDLMTVLAEWTAK